MGTITRYVAKNGEVTFQAKVRRKGYKSQSKSFVERKDAQKWVRAAEAAMDRGDHAQTAGSQSATDLASVLRRYADDVSPNKRGGKIEMLHIRRWLRECKEFLSTPVNQLSASKLAAWRDSQLIGRDPSSVSRQMTLMFAAINLARAEWGFVDIPVFKVARPKIPAHRDRVITMDEEKRLLADARPDLRRAIEFALATACRQSEIASLRFEDIDRSRKVARLHVTKNGEPRDVPLSQRALAAIGDGERGLVFGTPRASIIAHAFRRLCKRNRIYGLRFHDLRHSALTFYARGGLNPLQLAVISGHKDLKMLQIYTHLKADDLVPML